MLKFLAEAEAEMEAAARWYDDQRDGLSESFLAAITDAVVKVERKPRLYTAPPGLPTNCPHEVRRILLGDFPYSLVYWITGDAIRVAAVAHSRRKPGYWLPRLSE
jgi:toxin ParE1/3/4